MTAIYGEETRLAGALNRSTFSGATRQLEAYRHGHALFAGDAARIHPPLGGQGLNLGVQDATNLGWELAATVRGWAPDGLLDSYHDERHPPAARVPHHTSAQRILFDPLPNEDLVALRDIFADLMRLPDTNRFLAGMMSGLDAEGRVPDLELVTAGGPTRLARLLRSGRGLLVNPSGRLTPWADRVDVVHAPGAGPLLIRPDGVRCWSGESSLEDALHRCSARRRRAHLVQCPYKGTRDRWPADRPVRQDRPARGRPPGGR
ncbi:MAG TPA: FAD-dependent monooxygenase [Amycolatopsis sp.]|uniref:FAD-dependent monooxygenase n=1 Tax=Amycolatopsis sp. TaxID=37632 RepID=UPI002B45ED24|nr:FAD-dependent monooxygenase [Amycolatopsis sp.]HKS45145.1 FAD-dependent monooxygenase [Amycolatopsis sp.]